MKCYEFAIKPKEWENQDNKAVGNSLGMLRHDAYVSTCYSYQQKLTIAFYSKTT